MQVLLVGEPGDGVPAECHASGSLGVPGVDRLHGLKVLLVGCVVAGRVGHQRMRRLLHWRLRGGAFCKKSGFIFS